jgi:hypothetical protein
MPQFYKIDKGRRLVLSTGSGVFRRADALGHMEKLLQDPDFDPSYSQIADFTHVSKIDLSVQDIQELSQKSIFSAQSRRAFIVSNDVAYGLGRHVWDTSGKPGRNGNPHLSPSGRRAGLGVLQEHERLTASMLLDTAG